MTARALRIGFVIDDLGHGGAQRQLSLLAASLRGRATIRVVALSQTNGPHAGRLRDAGADVVLLPRRSSFEGTRVRLLIAALREFQPDVVHGFLDAANVYAFVAARRLGLPVVLSLRNDCLRLDGFRARVLRFMLRRADAVVANSRTGCELLSEHIDVPPERVHPLPNIVAGAASRAATETAMIGCVGRLVAWKRFDIVIDALRIVRETIPGARLTVVGDGPCRDDLRRRAAEFGDAVVFTGAVDEAAPLIAGFACLVVASEHEGTSNAALEAMAAGVPVVAVRAGDLEAMIEDGVSGRIVAERTPAAIAEAVVGVLADPRARELAARAGPATVGERFSAERARDALLTVYAAVMGGHK